MIIRSFLQWTKTASAAARAQGASALARAYLRGKLDPTDRRDAESALTALLDDGSPLVRLAMAVALAPSAATPHHIVTALAADQSDIAAVVLEGSPLLHEAELVDAAAVGDAVAQSAIARRVGLPVGVAAALAEVGALSACLDLLRNDTASLAPMSLARLIERFGDEAALRDLIGQRGDLDPGLRHDLVVATARALQKFVTGCAWLSPDRAGRITREAEDQACVTIAADSVREDGIWGVRRLLTHLRETGRLTPALMMRAILCGNLSLFEVAISDLSGMPLARVSGLVRGGRGLGFAALYGRSGLPACLLPVFEAAVREAGRDAADAGAGLRRGHIRRVLAACEAVRGDDLDTVVALLRRFEAEAARDDARSFALDLASDHAAAFLPRLSPQDRSLPLRTAA